MQIRRIVAPTDFSEGANQAVAYAFALAHYVGATLVLLHALDPSTLALEGPLSSGEGALLLQNTMRQARFELAQLLPEGQEATVEVTRQVVVGTPARTIVEVAAAEHADLIVMATHGRTGLDHMVLGSVAERVLRTAPCSVLTLRPTAATACRAGHT